LCSLHLAAPANWSVSYTMCGGQRQSPIDIDTPHTVYDSELASLTFNGYDTVNGQSTIVNITNSGHSG
jgi:carbonic anhydrase